MSKVVTEPREIADRGASNPPRAMLFDLDGTLIDTAPDITLAIDRTLRWLGRPAVDPARVRSWIGDGARALLDKALGEASTDAQWDHFAYEYGAACGEASCLYPGVTAMLDRLCAAGVKLGVVTNKEVRFAHRLLVRHGISVFFDVLVAGDSLPVKKPHPEGVHRALDALQVEPSDAALIGDSLIDLRTARAAGVQAWLVTYGYGLADVADADRPDRTIADFRELEPERIGAGLARVTIS
ncbi:MAG TPA: HAD-IA family hydrolase [Burkholderiaceae bacterium]|nr:HAD-IA family hydrolase [Burkholderiaceae bacterium]